MTGEKPKEAEKCEYCEHFWLEQEIDKTYPHCEIAEAGHEHCPFETWSFEMFLERWVKNECDGCVRASAELIIDDDECYVRHARSCGVENCHVHKEFQRIAEFDKKLIEQERQRRREKEERKPEGDIDG